MGCGWLGLPLGQQLATQGYQVKGSTTRAEKLPLLKNAGITPFEVELMPDPKGNLPALLETDILVINIPPRKGDGLPEFYLRQMRSLITAIKEQAVKKIIFTSATSVYPQNNQSVTEADAVKIQSPHSGLIWLDIENLFAHETAFETTIIRFSGLMGGEYQPGRYSSGRTLDGPNSPINMIHRDDCIGIIKTIIEQDLFGETFNASADIQPTRRELMEASCYALGLPEPVFTEISKPYRRVDCGKLKQQLGYRFIYPDPLTAIGK